MPFFSDEERRVSVVRHPNILFAFAYFDTAHTGVLANKDTEHILYSLGLGLTRSQVRVIRYAYARVEFYDIPMLCR